MRRWDIGAQYALAHNTAVQDTSYLRLPDEQGILLGFGQEGRQLLTPGSPGAQPPRRPRLPVLQLPSFGSRAITAGLAIVITTGSTEQILRPLLLLFLLDDIAVYMHQVGMEREKDEEACSLIECQRRAAMRHHEEQRASG